ncbi:MAG: entericidin A/B family lipoprotein [Alphaproteobacteria bacterium]|nr:entericidin A/B family lipoprotein [Alphaproteobacteria bacterium]
MKVNTVKKLMLIGMLTAFGACNTVQGAGEDVKSVGKAGERELDKAQGRTPDTSPK